MFKKFGKAVVNSLLAVVAFAAIYTFGCTAYYNFFDPRMNELSSRFLNQDYGEMRCDADYSYRDESGNPVMPQCWGGVLELRDTYLEERGVASFGEWRSDGWIFFASTFQFYFKYK